jgi:hypothetical protein
MPRTAPMIVGEVQNITASQFTINDQGLNYIIEYNSGKNNLINGDHVKIWGDRKLLSRKVIAHTICKI